MNVAILGSGSIGGNLGKLLARAGHAVCFGSRDPARLEGLLEAAGNKTRAGSVAEAVESADLVVEALPFAITMELSPEHLAGKVLASSANYYPQRDGTIDLGGMTHTEALAQRLTKTRVVKAFNMLYYKELEARLSGDAAQDTAMLYAGDDSDAKRLVAQIIRDAGFVPIDTGDLASGGLFQTDGPFYNRPLSESRTRRLLDELTGS